MICLIARNFSIKIMLFEHNGNDRVDVTVRNSSEYWRHYALGVSGIVGQNDLSMNPSLNYNIGQ